MVIVTVHSAGGSTSEAMDAQFAFGPYPDRATAKKESERFWKACAAISPDYFAMEWDCRLVTLPSTPQTAQDLVQQVDDAISKFTKDFG